MHRFFDYMESSVICWASVYSDGCFKVRSTLRLNIDECVNIISYVCRFYNPLTSYGYIFLLNSMGKKLAYARAKCYIPKKGARILGAKK